MSNRRLYKDFTVTLKNGRQVTAEVEALISYDPYYGADADGNRGVPMNFLEDLKLSHPVVTDDEDYILSNEEMLEADDLIMNKAELDDWEENLDDTDYDFEC